MPTWIGLEFAPVMDVLIRITLVLAAGLLLAIPARKNAALRHALLVAGLVMACLVPATMMAMRAMPVSRWQVELPLLRAPHDSLAADPSSVGTPHEMSDHAPTHNRTSAPMIETRGANVRSGPINERSALGLLFAVLVIVAFSKAGGLMRSLIRVRSIVARANPVASESAGSLLELVQRRVRMRRPLRLVESPEISAPFAAGIIGNYILLPIGWAERLSRDQLLSVLGHEAAHLARRDHLVVLLQELLASALWFHPLVHLFNRTLHRVREEVCDNYAIAIVDRPAYCDALLLLAVGHDTAPVRGATAMWPRGWSLEARIRGLLDDRRHAEVTISRRTRSATIVFAVALFALVAAPQWAASRPPVRPTGRHADSPARSESSEVANQQTKRIIKTFPVIDGKTLHLENLAGRVELVPGNGPSVEVEAFVRVGDLPKEAGQRLLEKIQWIEVPGTENESRRGLSWPADEYSTIRYAVAGETKTDTDMVRYLDRKVRVSRARGESIPSVEFDLRISLPREARIAIDNAVGPIDGHSIVCATHLATRHGAIKLEDVRAPLDASSEYGDVLISRLSADAAIRTVAGGIDLVRIHQGQVTVATRTGPCRIRELPKEGFRLQYAGPRPIKVWGGGIAQIASSNDTVRLDLFSAGRGGPSISVTTVSGDVAVETGP